MTDSGFSDTVLEYSEAIPRYLNGFPSILRDQRDVLEKLYTLLEESRAVHLYGKGRSANAAVSLALRLKHFGYNVWFIGDVVKERIKRGDLVILFSGSGETSEVVDVAKKAKMDEAKVVAVTSYRDSTLARDSDLILYLPGGLEKREGWAYLEAQLTTESVKESIFYGGGEFETIAYLFQETLVSALGRFKKIPESKVISEHDRDEVLKG